MPQTLDYLLRSRATQADILIAFRDRLRMACPGCTDLSCFISDQPMPAFIPAGGHCVTISIGDGIFDQKLFTGGGSSTLNEDSQVVITVMHQIVIDRIPQAEAVLTDECRGLLAFWKFQVLRTLLLADPDEADSKPWEPAIGDKPLCREHIRPVHTSAPGEVPGKPSWYGFNITFAVSFDWDLRGDVSDG